mmetsp:Transcript_7286/g.21151  ORF Transcript_7286/g.21151 Transcript_7286/m.21151 type:complete len:245 (+) Transcript_7286:221-955(+)
MGLGPCPPAGEGRGRCPPAQPRGPGTGALCAHVLLGSGNPDEAKLRGQGQGLPDGWRPVRGEGLRDVPAEEAGEVQALQRLRPMRLQVRPPLPLGEQLRRGEELEVLPALPPGALCLVLLRQLHHRRPREAAVPPEVRLWAGQSSGVGGVDPPRPSLLLQLLPDPGGRHDHDHRAGDHAGRVPRVPPQARGDQHHDQRDVQVREDRVLREGGAGEEGRGWCRREDLARLARGHGELRDPQEPGA